MSKASTTSAPKIPAPLPAKSAWSRGPPQSTTNPNSRSQSPAPSSQFHPTHSRRSSTLGQAVPVKDGVSVSRGNVGAIKQGESYRVEFEFSGLNLISFTSASVTFGSIDDTSASIPSSTIPAPVVKQSEGVKTFGTVPANIPIGHVNGKASISSRTSVVAPGSSTSASSTAALSAALSTASSTATSPAPPDPSSSKLQLDVKKLFQNPQTTTTSSVDTSSPVTRNTGLPQSSSSHHPHPPPQMGHHPYSSFPPNSIRPGQHSGSNGTPRSPSFSRAMPNGAVSRPPGGQSGGPPSAGLPSPRLGPHSQGGLPPPAQMSMTPTMPMWPSAYYVSAFLFLSQRS